VKEDDQIVDDALRWFGNAFMNLLLVCVAIALGAFLFVMVVGLGANSTNIPPWQCWMYILGAMPWLVTVCKACSTRANQKWNNE